MNTSSELLPVRCASVDWCFVMRQQVCHRTDKISSQNAEWEPCGALDRHSPISLVQYSHILLVIHSCSHILFHQYDVKRQISASIILVWVEYWNQLVWPLARGFLFRFYAICLYFCRFNLWRFLYWHFRVLFFVKWLFTEPHVQSSFHNFLF